MELTVLVEKKVVGMDVEVWDQDPNAIHVEIRFIDDHKGKVLRRLFFKDILVREMVVVPLDEIILSTFANRDGVTLSPAVVAEIKKQMLDILKKDGLI